MIRRIAVSFALFAVVAHSAVASASGLSGNPITDGWTFAGNSQTNGVWVDNSTPLDGLPDTNYDLYQTSYTLASSVGSFQAGDQIIGLGGVVLGDIGTSSINALAKFGSPTSTWQAASSVGAPDGVGDDASGGNGYILARIDVPSNSLIVNRWDSSTPSFVPLANASDYLSFADTTELGTYQYNGTQTTNFLRSWEVQLDVSALARAGYTDVPTANSPSLIGMQGLHPGDYHYENALVQHVPEPATWLLATFGLAAFGWVARRRALCRCN